MGENVCCHAHKVGSNVKTVSQFSSSVSLKQYLDGLCLSH